jgi:hypothetical protein
MNTFGSPNQDVKISSKSHSRGRRAEDALTEIIVVWNLNILGISCDVLMLEFSRIRPQLKYKLNSKIHKGVGYFSGYYTGYILLTAYGIF